MSKSEIVKGTKRLRKCRKCGELFVMIKNGRYICEVCWAFMNDGYGCYECGVTSPDDWCGGCGHECVKQPKEEKIDEKNGH